MSVPDLQPVVQAVGWTLLHFVWQGVAIGVIFALVMRLAGAVSSRFRYRAALALFLCAGLAPVVTFFMVFESAVVAAAPLGGVLAVSAPAAAGGAEMPLWLTLERTLQPYLPWAVALWLAGVIVMSGRVCLDWWQVRRLTWVGVAPLPARWEARVAELVRTFGVSRPVRVLRSSVVRVPAVIGWLHPVVLIPTAALAGLSARQLELIIAHELAHIRRADYLVNLLQVVVETVLFYHPVVRWMSNRLREERELCCDDAVVGTLGDTLTYAHALTELEAQRQQSFQTALAASGGHLTQRIYRMLERPVPRRNTLIWSMSLVVGLAAGSMALGAQLALTRATVPGPGAETVSEPAASAPSIEPTAETAREAARSAGATGPAANRPSRSPSTPAPVERSGRTEPDPAAGTGQRENAGKAPAAPTASADDDAPEGGDVANGPDGDSAEPSEDRGAAADPAGEVTAEPSAATRPSPEPAPSNVETGTESAAAVPRSGPSSADDAGSGTDEAESSEDEGDASGQKAPDQEAVRLARAKRAESKAAAPPEPVVRGGEPLHVGAPEYPRRARLRGLQGNVTARFTIGRDGRVHDIEIVESSPAGVFDRSVKKALQEWRFTPLTRNGEPVARRVSKAFEFNLADGRAGRSRGEEACYPVTGTRICRPRYMLRDR